MDTLCAALADQGATPLPVFCGSLRSADSGLTELLRPASAVITTVLAAGGATAVDATSEGDWDAGVLARLDALRARLVGLRGHVREDGARALRPKSSRASQLERRQACR